MKACHFLTFMTEVFSKLLPYLPNLPMHYLAELIASCRT